MLFTQSVWENWFIMALLAPFFMALVNVLDIYFVDRVYEDAWDGVLVFSFFQLIPWVLCLFGMVRFQYPGLQALDLALLGGIFFSTAIFFYFKSLFATNDMVSIQVMASLSIPLVPFLAWMLSGEQLALTRYIGIGVAFFGALVLSFNKKIQTQELKKILPSMISMVFFLAFSMILQSKTYSLIGHDFWSGFLLFSAGEILAGFLLLSSDCKPVLHRMKHIALFSKAYLPVFLLAEGFNMLAVLSSQRAIDLSPSVSFVSAIESLNPVFVLLMSFVLASILLFFDRKKAQLIYRNQLSASGVKIVAACIMAFGVYLIN